MNILLSRPNDDDDIIDVYFVQHRTRPDTTMKKFESEWDEEVNQAKKRDLEEWNVSQVIHAMEAKGWDITHINYITTVTY